jgi:hypothetical protein
VEKKTMKIPVHYSLKVARAVVAKIDLPKEVAKNCTIESWSNGREQGLCIKRFFPLGESKSIVVAQQRSSDDILIVAGTCSDFDFQTNHPSDDIWDKDGARTHFNYNEKEKAARYIETLLGIENKVAKTIPKKAKKAKKAKEVETKNAEDTEKAAEEDAAFRKSDLAELLT